MSKLFEIIIFTASKKIYADPILNYLDPNNEYISYRLYREQCITIKEKILIKDLRIINRDLKNLAIVDNSISSFAF